MIIRLMDIVASGFVLLVLTPLFIPIMVLLKITGEGEIFYIQKRIGKQQKEFQLLKFATMLKNSPNIGAGTITLENDFRVLPLGKFLRKTKINELPQLLNVLLGDMSLIGPRPLTLEIFNIYDVNTRNIVASVKPGLSGIGSVVFRQEDKIIGNDQNAEIIYEQIISPYKAALEIWYIKNQSLSVYLITIFCTVWVIIFSNSNLLFKIFKSLPKPPDEISSRLGF
jgi:lipopolysaccharide/colanic/teichoic acid biosynthesis glycosyltransferase